MLTAELKGEKVKLTADLERAKKWWNYSRGKWIETRLSMWDEDVKRYSREIDYINTRLDEISEIEFPSEALAAE